MYILYTIQSNKTENISFFKNLIINSSLCPGLKFQKTKSIKNLY